jgi:Gas vesicle synthesis protein GvpL/GvpF
MALYVYGVMRATGARRAIGAAKARSGPRLDTVEHGPVSALVAAVPEGQLTIRRENILSHADVLAAAFEQGPVLPMRLGTAMVDEAAVARDLLAPQADALAARLDAVDGKAEMQVKAIYAEEPLMRSVLSEDPHLMQAVERTRTLPAAATHFEQIRIGEAIAAAVEARQTTDGQTLMAALAPLAIAVRLSPPHHERAVMNAAFLIDTNATERFDGAVEQLSQERSPDIEFKLIGPMPPYSFADGDWEGRERAEVRAGWA